MQGVLFGFQVTGCMNQTQESWFGKKPGLSCVWSHSQYREIQRILFDLKDFLKSVIISKTTVNKIILYCFTAENKVQCSVVLLRLF